MELTGKRITFLGDSITEGWGTSDFKYRYDNVLARERGLGSIYTNGIGGTRIAYQRGASGDPRHDLYYCGRAAELDLSGDAVNTLIRILRRRFPASRIVFMTPTRRLGGEVPNASNGKTLGEYAAAIVNACEHFGVDVLDLYNTLPLDPDKDEDCAKYTIDGLHPNDAGHALIADALGRFLESL